MEKVLNRGLNFAILPLKLDITQVLVDFRRFERTMVWNEFWFGRDSDTDRPKPIFRQNKTNFPKKYRSPQGLKDCLAAVKSELVDPKNRHKVKPNLPEDEIQALKMLIRLQKERQIVIKPCDKGAGILILDFKEYMRACIEHLESKTQTGKSYYKEVDEGALGEAREQIDRLIEEGLNNDIISKEEYNAMKPQEIKPGRFYALFKVHKQHEIGKAPPPRPIVSASGSLTENIAIYVEHHLKQISKSHESYLQDTPDFLRQVEQLNAEGPLPEHALLVVIDAVGLYTNIPQEEGVECVNECLEQRNNSRVPSGFITRLLELILKYNIFEFNNKLYQQIIGTAMGTKPAPSYADIFMAMKIDKKMWELAEKFKTEGEVPIKFLKRFLDDIFTVFLGSIKTLHEFINELNQVHTNLKFTMTHTTPKSAGVQCACEPTQSIPFLDTLCEIKHGKIITDLYRKPTDKNQYLLTDSCHPVQVTKNIPFSLCMRINRICSEIPAREKRFLELKEMLLERDYPESIIDAAIAKAREIPREDALRKVSRQESNSRPTFVVLYDPRLPSVQQITQRHWRSMVSQDQYLYDVFPSPPLVAYKRQRNVKDALIRAKIAPPGRTHEKRFLPGMKKCGKCLACSYIYERKAIHMKKFTWKITREVNCESSNVIYLLECTKQYCKSKYIGETERNFRERIFEHIGYVRTKKLNQTSGYHFNLPGHSISDMKFSIVEKVKMNDQLYRKEREKYHINKFNTLYNGMNRRL